MNLGWILATLLMRLSLLSWVVVASRRVLLLSILIVRGLRVPTRSISLCRIRFISITWMILTILGAAIWWFDMNLAGMLRCVSTLATRGFFLRMTIGPTFVSPRKMILLVNVRCNVLLATVRLLHPTIMARLRKVPS